MSNDKSRHDPQPDHGRGPPDGKGRPDDHGRPVPPHMKQPLHRLKVDFELKMRCRLTDRNPPQHIIDFVERGAKLPPVSDALAMPAVITR
jgi:hypothetical protein